MRSLLDTLVAHTEPDMDRFSCSMAIDMMEAYYKVALKKVVDDVSVLAIERCLIQELSGLLSPEIVCDLVDDEVQRIAGESDGSIAARTSAVEKLRVLENGIAELKRLRKHNHVMLDVMQEVLAGSDAGLVTADVAPATPEESEDC